jgi:hypothetical protein
VIAPILLIVVCATQVNATVSAICRVQCAFGTAPKRHSARRDRDQSAASCKVNHRP